MSNKYYTYIHIRKDSGQVFYVGKGTGKRAYSKHHRNNLWHKIVAKHGYTVELISEWETEEEAFQDEIRLIEQYKNDGFAIANFTLGGDGATGYTHSIKTKNNLSERAKLFFSNEENAKRMADIRKAQWTDEARKKSSESHKKLWADQDYIEKQKKSRKEAYSTEEMRQLQADRNKAYRESSVGKDAMSKRIKEYWASPQSQTEEAKRKRSESIKKGWITKRKLKNADN
jgi:hypothetical protein